MRPILVALVLGVLLASSACATAAVDSEAEPATTAQPPASTPAAATETAAPRPAGPPPGPFEAQSSDGVAFLTSFGGAGDAVAYEVVATVGSDGCLCFETSGPHPGPETQTWLGVIGSPSIEVTAEGLRSGSTAIPYGTPFPAGSTAIPPFDEMPTEHAERCSDADQAWSIDIFVLGATLAIGGAAIHRWITDDSRPGLALAHVVRADLPGFASTAAPSEGACGDRRGCVEGVVGDGVAIYRYASLDLARQSVSHGDADVYRTDRLVLELNEGMSDEERLLLIQDIEGTWTRSSD